jgi:hypothetical protein
MHPPTSTPMRGFERKASGFSQTSHKHDYLLIGLSVRLHNPAGIVGSPA